MHAIEIHLAGVELEDMKAEHVVKLNGDYRLIDFSVSSGDHRCLGLSGCSELSGLASELGVSVATSWGIYQLVLWRKKIYVGWQFVLIILVGIYVVGSRA